MVTTHKIETWEQLESVNKKLRLLTESQWVYRGKASENRRSPLRSSLSTLFEDFSIRDGKSRTWLELNLIREFQRKCHHYEASHLPEDGDILEWLALMRHYGAPTRLLDWTYSIYVATFFALEQASDLATVWFLDAKACRDATLKVLNISNGEGKHFDRTVIEQLFVAGKSKPCAYPVNSFRMNERQTIQQGLFIFPGDLNRAIPENLRELLGMKSERALQRMVIKGKHRREFLLRLRRMNMTAATLKPGLDGFAESLRADWYVLDKDLRRRSRIILDYEDGRGIIQRLRPEIIL